MNKEKIFERNKFGWPNYGRILNEKNNRPKKSRNRRK